MSRIGPILPGHAVDLEEFVTPVGRHRAVSFFHMLPHFLLGGIEYILAGPVPHGPPLRVMQEPFPVLLEKARIAGTKWHSPNARPEAECPYLVGKPLHSMRKLLR